MGRWPWLISTFLLLALSACQPSADTALGTAQRFLDEHYVRIDLQKAKTYTTGLASHKLAEEERLIEGQVIDESTRKPHVHYKLLETHPGDGGAVTFLFEGTIRVDDAGIVHPPVAGHRQEGRRTVAGLELSGVRAGRGRLVVSAPLERRRRFSITARIPSRASSVAKVALWLRDS